jgi:hypothetical protein
LLVRPYNEQIAALKELALSESTILLARKTVNRHVYQRDLAICLAVEKLVPCILHMKLRVTEKIFQTLINLGLDRYGESLADGKKRRLFELSVTECMRGKVFGSEESGRQAQWKFNWAKDKRSIDKPNFDGADATKFMMGFKTLASAIYSSKLDEEAMPEEKGNETRTRNKCKLEMWNDIATILLPLFRLIEQKEDYSEEDILKLHRVSNTFMCHWVDLGGTSYMTNYIHIIGAGHLSYFGKKYGNLYRFSQQGWEGMNKLLKHYYFNNTNHGGSYGNGGKAADGSYTCGTVSGDHCRPLMRLCQRTIMWTLGLGDTYFENKEAERKQNKELKRNLPQTLTDERTSLNNERIDNRGSEQEENIQFGIL